MTTTTIDTEALCLEWEREIYRTQHRVIKARFDGKNILWDTHPDGRDYGGPPRMVQEALERIRETLSFEEEQERLEIVGYLCRNHYGQMSLTKLKKIKRLVDRSF